MNSHMHVEKPTFRRMPPEPLEGWSASLAVMDKWEVDPADWDPRWYRHVGRDCHDIWVCTGCYAWQVQYQADGLASDLDDPEVETAYFAAIDIAEAHRDDCPAFDMLSGLAIPAFESGDYDFGGTQ